MRTIEAEEVKSPPGYGKPPWVFKGSALYQLHLVKAETARAFIPQEFKLVEAFGYTLGGFFLAKYDDSPAGSFDELVVIAGIVWNPPTSCAWAARVLVNSDEACIHGRKEVGLPSQVARFSKTITAIPMERKSYANRFLNLVGIGTQVGDQKNCLGIQVKELGGTSETDICSISTVQELKSNKFMGPVIKMSLPSFSGNTEHRPQLLKYSCQLECRVRVVEPAKVSSPCLAQNGGTKQFSEPKNPTPEDDTEESRRNMSISVMLSKPIFALEFNCLKMQVEAPVAVSTSSS